MLKDGLVRSELKKFPSNHRKRTTHCFNHANTRSSKTDCFAGANLYIENQIAVDVSGCCY